MMKLRTNCYSIDSVYVAQAYSAKRGSWLLAIAGRMPSFAWMRSWF